MPKPTQRSRRRTHRLLLPVGLGIGAGITIALALGSPAHADDRPIADTIHGVVQLPGRILTDQPADGDRPEPVRDLVRQVLDDTKAAAADTTKAVDEVTRPVPVAGRAVDEVTDTTNAVVEAVTKPVPRRAPEVKPTPTVAPTTAPTASPAAEPAATNGDTVDQPTPAAAASGAKAAPEPTPAGPPVPGGTGSGAPTLAAQYPDAHTTAAPERAVSSTARSQVAPRDHLKPRDAAPSPRRSPRISPGNDHADHHVAGSMRTLEHTAGPGRTLGPPRWQHPHTGHHPAHHDGRTQPPSPPPG